MVPSLGLFSPTRVPQGVSSATVYPESTIEDVLRELMGKICLTWVDNTIIWPRDDAESVRGVDRVLGWLMNRGMFAAGHEAVLYMKKVECCGRTYPGMQTRHDPERVEALLRVRRSTTAVELWHFLQAINGMPTALPGLARLERPLRDVLQDMIKGRKRHKRSVDRRVIVEEEWTTERFGAWESVRRRIAEEVPLCYPGDDWQVMLVTDASDPVGRGAVTQVVKEEVAREIPIEDMFHEPLGFVSRSCRGE